jgi:hypothetical protein
MISCKTLAMLVLPELDVPFKRRTVAGCIRFLNPMRAAETYHTRALLATISAAERPNSAAGETGLGDGRCSGVPPTSQNGSDLARRLERIVRRLRVSSSCPASLLHRS